MENEKDVLLKAEATDGRAERIYQTAYQMFRRNPDWIHFYKRVLGLRGLVRRSYPTPDALAEFERSDVFRELQRLLTRLREKKPEEPRTQEATRVITVRLPESLHDSLRSEAHERKTSMNKLCISKLLQFIDEELVPTELRTKKPTPVGELDEQEGQGVDL